MKELKEDCRIIQLTSADSTWDVMLCGEDISFPKPINEPVQDLIAWKEHCEANGVKWIQHCKHPNRLFVYSENGKKYRMREEAGESRFSAIQREKRTQKQPSQAELDAAQILEEEKTKLAKVNALARIDISNEVRAVLERM